MTGLIARAGWWTGHETFEKGDYDTHENRQLTELNKAILRAAEIDRNYQMEFSPTAIDRISKAWRTLDRGPFERFVAECNGHQPWIWKDPRLWLTIRPWQELVDLDSVQFILLTREHLQRWISTTLRRQIQTYAYCKRYGEQVKQTLVDFLEGTGRGYLELCFEDLIVRPEPTLMALNSYLGTALNLADWRATYTKKLYRKPRGLRDFGHALMIYLKNYSQRYR